MESQNNWADAAIAQQEKEYPNMKYLDERVVDDSDADIAYNKTKELIQKYPDLKGILGTGWCSPCDSGNGPDRTGIRYFRSYAQRSG